MTHPLKYLCMECGWTGTDPLNAPHPFIEGDSVLGCPKCKEMELRKACEADDCWQEVSCGMNTQEGYKLLCSKHGLPLMKTTGQRT